MLDRIRIGESVKKNYNTAESNRKGDVDVLRSRQLSHIFRSNPTALQAFRHASIIVGTRKIRDAINTRLIKHYAAETDEEVQLYYARDYITQQAVEGSLKEQIWNVSRYESHGDI